LRQFLLMRPQGSKWRSRWVGLRNRVLSSQSFQYGVTRVPGLRSIAHSRARQVFDLVAGFTYSPVLAAAVELGVFDHLASEPQGLSTLSIKIGLSEAAASRLIRAMAALELAEEVAPGQWMLGRHGAVIQADRGVQAMIRHHRLLFADLADPVALLRADRREDTALSRFWTYARGGSPTHQSSTAYSELMAESQAMVAREVLAAYDFSRHRAVLDVGGGHGAFLRTLATRHPRLELGLFDLPGVVEDDPASSGRSPPAEGWAAHPGDFFSDPLPAGYDCITLVRILHDHDDEDALRLLRAVCAALPAGGRLIIAEPMAKTPGAEAMAAYFEFYLWAMGSGRPRAPDEIGTLLRRAGFRRWALRRCKQPVICSMVVADT
jgi:demethylspheroidene O-methyltransferase